MDRYDQSVVDTAAEKSEIVCRAFGPQSPECIYERQRAQMILQAATCAAQPNNPYCPGRMGLVYEFLSQDPEPMVSGLLSRLPRPQSALQGQWMAQQAADRTIDDPIGDATYGNPYAADPAPDADPAPKPNPKSNNNLPFVILMILLGIIVVAEIIKRLK